MTVRELDVSVIGMPMFPIGTVVEGSAFDLSSHQRAREALAFGLDAPGTDYNVQVDYGTVGAAALSQSASVTTAIRGDVSDGSGGPPNGVANFLDISAVVDGFRNVAGALPVPRLDLIATGGCGTDQLVNFLDISNAVDAFQQEPEACPGPCP